MINIVILKKHDDSKKSTVFYLFYFKFTDPHSGFADEKCSKHASPAESSIRLIPFDKVDKNKEDLILDSRNRNNKIISEKAAKNLLASSTPLTCLLSGCESDGNRMDPFNNLRDYFIKNEIEFHIQSGNSPKNQLFGIYNYHLIKGKFTPDNLNLLLLLLDKNEFITFTTLGSLLKGLQHDDIIYAISVNKPILSKDVPPELASKAIHIELAKKFNNLQKILKYSENDEVIAKEISKLEENLNNTYQGRISSEKRSEILKRSGYDLKKSKIVTIEEMLQRMEQFQITYAH